MTTEAVADLLAVTPRRVRQLATSRELPARRENGRWSFDRAEVAVYAEGRKP
jgi:excisionase family DNA binding protein